MTDFPARFSPDRGSSVLLVVDVQEKFLPVLFEADRLLQNCAIAIRAARILGVPVLVTEQYPQGLGPVVAPLRDALGDFAPIEKVAFSCFGCVEFAEKLADLGRTTLLLTGIETHVCVLQTALAGLRQGYDVHALADATTSRAAQNWQWGLERMRQAGAVITSTEMTLFELLGEAGTEEFRAVQTLLK